MKKEALGRKERIWFVTKRGRNPYSGPSWGTETPRWFTTKSEAQECADRLSSRNPVGFTVELSAPGWGAGEYPLFEKIGG